MSLNFHKPEFFQYTCPTFSTVLNCVGNCIVGRHTIVDTNYYTNGIDPNSSASYPIHVVDSGGGNYAFRLGDAVTGGVDTVTCYTGTCLGPHCYARAEGIRLTFNVTAQNTFFTYKYAAFFQNGGHLPGEAARFEVRITLPNLNDTLIPGGDFILVANNANPYCPTTGPSFHSNGVWQYTDWTSVTTNLSNYIGDSIAVEFRTSDCFPGQAPTTIINGNCTTTCQNGICCTNCGIVDSCNGTFACSNQPGSHSAYAYIDAYCAATVGINELSNNTAIRIYPNPMTSSCIIEINGTKATEIIIYDMLGKELIRRKLTANKTEIRKGDLERGIYFVRVNEYVKKLIIE